MNENKKHEEGFVCFLKVLDFDNQIWDCKKHIKLKEFLKRELDNEKIEGIQLNQSVNNMYLLTGKPVAKEFLQILSTVTYRMLRENIYICGGITFGGDINDNPKLIKLEEKAFLPRIIVDGEARNNIDNPECETYLKKSWNEDDVYYVDYLNIICNPTTSSDKSKEVFNTILDCVQYLDDNSISKKFIEQYEFIIYYFSLSINLIKSLQDARHSEEIQIPDELKI